VRDETSEWLAPMLDAADANTVRGLMVQASMPIPEADSPELDWLAQHDPHARAIDWIRFGHLLRHELGWDDTYPAEPQSPRD